MEKTTKVQLTEKWWNTNKAKTLSDKGNLGKALKTYESATGKTLPKGRDRYLGTLASIKACDELLAAAQKTADACTKNINDATKFVLEGKFPEAVKAAKKGLEKDRDDLKKWAKALTIANILKDRSLCADMIKFAKTKHTEENIMFLLSYKAKDKKVYDTFIKTGSDHEVNIDDIDRKALDMHANAGTLKNASWDGAVKKVLFRAQSNDLDAYKRYLVQEKAS